MVLVAVRLKLGAYELRENDRLGRSAIGYFPRMTEDEAWQAGRGVWKMNAARAARQKFAVVVGEGRIRVVAEITGVTVLGDRVALEGHVLPAGHPLRERYLDTPDPVVNGSQNPVGYCDLDGEDEFALRPCACGCDELTDRDFLPGHDVRAMQDRVRTHFAGSPLKFITWVDHHLQTSSPDTTATDAPAATSTTSTAVGASR